VTGSRAEAIGHEGETIGSRISFVSYSNAIFSGALGSLITRMSEEIHSRGNAGEPNVSDSRHIVESKFKWSSVPSLSDPN